MGKLTMTEARRGISEGSLRRAGAGKHRKGPQAAGSAVCGWQLREFPLLASNFPLEREERPPERWRRCRSRTRGDSVLRGCLRTLPSTWRGLWLRAVLTRRPPGPGPTGFPRPRPPPPYPEQCRILLRLVTLLGRVFPGDAEEGLVRVLPAQPRVAPALDLRHQPVAEAQGAPGPLRGSPAVGDLPFLPPPGIAGHRGRRAPRVRSGARGDWTPPARRGTAGPPGRLAEAAKAKVWPGRFHFPFCPLPREALSCRPSPVSLAPRASGLLQRCWRCGGTPRLIGGCGVG